MGKHKMGDFERLLGLLKPKTHIPTAQYIAYLWKRYAEPEKWDWDLMTNIATSAPVYIAKVRFEEQVFSFIQVGGGRAVTEFFMEQGKLPQYCNCGAVELIMHRKSPWAIVLPEGEIHDEDCSVSIIGLDSDQLHLGIVWMILGITHQLSAEDDNGYT